MAAFGIILAIDGHPDEFAVVDEDAVGTGFSKDEVSFDEAEDVIDNGLSGHFSLVIAIVMHKAVDEELAQAFSQ